MGAPSIRSITDLARTHRRSIITSLHHTAGTGGRAAADTGHHHLLAKGSIDKLWDTAASCTCVVIARVRRGLLPCKGIGGAVGGG